MFWRRFWRWICLWIGSCWVVCLWAGFVFLDLDCVFGIVILSSPLFAVFSLSASPLSALLSCHRRVFFAACAVYPLVCAIFALFSFGAPDLFLFDVVVNGEAKARSMFDRNCFKINPFYFHQLKSSRVNHINFSLLAQIVWPLQFVGCGSSNSMGWIDVFINR
jgi:hypothetical protein